MRKGFSISNQRVSSVKISSPRNEWISLPLLVPNLKLQLGTLNEKVGDDFIQVINSSTLLQTPPFLRCGCEASSLLYSGLSSFEN
jgi:hypothetical protein